jgi:ABC-type transporter Mla subunit MlaD
VNAQRTDLQRFIDNADGAAQTFSQRAAHLRRTLAEAPSALSSLQTLLANLRTTAQPLGPAARNIAASAPALDATLTALPGFRRAAQPALDEIVAAAPALTQLGRGAAPVISRAVPTLKSFAAFAAGSQKATQALGASTPDLLGVLEGWGRAIQGRDGLSHVFHGQVSLGANALETLLDAIRAETGPRKHGRKPSLPNLPSVKPDAPQLKLPKTPLPDVTSKLPQLAQQLTDALGAGIPAPQAQRAGDLLDFLLQP